jgi:flagellar biosynthesis/type III secretory pathway protein FliH
MELWLQLINAETEEELTMLESTNVKEINQAILVLRELNADEKMRYLADMREKALHDEANALNSAEKRGVEKGRAEGEKRGLAKGRAEGRAEGKMEERMSMIAKMKAAGMSDEQIEAIINQ